MKLVKLVTRPIDSTYAANRIRVRSALESAGVPLRIRASEAVTRAWRVMSVTVGHSVVFDQETEAQHRLPLVSMAALDRRSALRIVVARPGDPITIEASGLLAGGDVQFEYELWGVTLRDLPYTRWKPDVHHAVTCEVGHELILHPPQNCIHCIEQIEGEHVPCPASNGERYCMYPQGHGGDCGFGP